MESRNPFAPPSSRLEGVLGSAGDSIRYDLRRWDYIRGTMSVVIHMPVTQFVWGALILVAGYSGWSDAADRGEIDRVMIAILNSLALWLAASLSGFVVVALMALFMKGKGLFGEHTLTIRAEGLEEETKYSITIHKWFGLHAAKRRGRYHYVYVVEDRAHIIPPPSRVEGDVVAFIDAVKTRIELARH